MEIGKVNKYYKTQVNNTKSNAKTSKSSNVAKKDSVEFSTELNSINDLKKKMETTEDVRIDKVEAVKERIDSGEYKVDSEKVAEKIIDELIWD